MDFGPEWTPPAASPCSRVPQVLSSKTLMESFDREMEFPVSTSTDARFKPRFGFCSVWFIRFGFSVGLN